MSNIFIVNLNSNKTTIADSSGNFKIDTKLNDTIQLRAFQFISQKIIITDSIFKETKINIKLKEKVIPLNEVILYAFNLSGNSTANVKNIKLDEIISASSLGLPNADVIPLTINERLLAEADSEKFIRFVLKKDTLHNPFAEIELYTDLHKTINRISGRTKKMRNRVSFEKESKIREQIINTFSEQIIIEEFNIPKKKVQAFLDYCEVQPDFFKLFENTPPAGESVSLVNPTN